MKLAVYTQKGEKKEDMTVSKIFDVTANARTITEYINYLRAALRAPVANTKNRSQVSGGGRKPWRQKGTGNARAGSSRSPLWVGGGVTFGPTSEQNFSKRINAKVKRTAILSIIGDIMRSKKFIILDEWKLSEAKTKKATQVLEAVKADGKIATLISSGDENASLALRNIGGVKTMSANKLDMIYLMSSTMVVASKEAVKGLEKVFSGKSEKENE